MSASENPFAAACATEVARLTGLDSELFSVTAPPKPELGDFAVGLFPAAKALRKAPPAIAAEVASQFQAGDLLATATAAGPFVNFRANRKALFRYVMAGAGDGSLIPTSPGQDKTVCIDYSSPNISKHLAYHHIRSTVIGHALANLYRALGYRVIGINHLGDWGTTHGMLIAAYHKWPPGDSVSIDQLNEMYVRFRKEAESDPSLEDEARAWFKKLEDRDPEATRIWNHFRDVSLAEFQEVYDTLGIEFEEIKGESDFLDDMPKVLELLADKGLSAESDGALVVPLGENIPPLLLKKQDGATLYATRDLAAAMYRWNEYGFHRSLYVVGRGQGLHFKQLFLTLEKAGFQWAERCEHVSFGLVRIGGKKTGTRKGNVVLLKEVLAEAANRSQTRIREENPKMGQEALEATARDVGIGAIVFANLSSQRDKDVDFEWEDVLSVSGDSGPYVQYAHARISSILRKAAERGLSPTHAPDELEADGEWQLAKKLTEIGDILVRASTHNEPHILCRYLLDLAADFSRFYTAGNQDPSLRVLCEDDDLARARLGLVDATQRVLARGLAILGIGAPNAM
ncbi:MAG: arginine--tRNA ligase [Deltaproteobacteria bacterium]|nr:arginine--tRNA ligase [Deltaproteobacteria bacterium]